MRIHSEDGIVLKSIHIQWEWEWTRQHDDIHWRMEPGFGIELCIFAVTDRARQADIRVLYLTCVYKLCAVYLTYTEWCVNALVWNTVGLTAMNTNTPNATCMNSFTDGDFLQCSYSKKTNHTQLWISCKKNNLNRVHKTIDQIDNFSIWLSVFHF